MGSPSAPKSETVYKPGKETVYQTYTPMYIQKALAGSSQVAQENLQKARDYYAASANTASVMPGAGIKMPEVPTFEIYDTTKFLPGEEEIAKGEEKIKQQQKNQKQKQKEKDKAKELELYNAAVMTSKFGKPGVNSKIFSWLLFK